MYESLPVVQKKFVRYIRFLEFFFGKFEVARKKKILLSPRKTLRMAYGVHRRRMYGLVALMLRLTPRYVGPHHEVYEWSANT